MLVSEWQKFQQRMADSLSNGSENEEVVDQIILSLNYEKLEHLDKRHRAALKPL